jgi:hypothetical protein
MTSAYQTPPMVQGGHPRRHLCAKVTVSNRHLKEASVEHITTIGLDIAKQVFHAHGAAGRLPSAMTEAHFRTVASGCVCAAEYNC